MQAHVIRAVPKEASLSDACHNFSIAVQVRSLDAADNLGEPSEPYTFQVRDIIFSASPYGAASKYVPWLCLTCAYV